MESRSLCGATRVVPRSFSRLSGTERCLLNSRTRDQERRAGCPRSGAARVRRQRWGHSPATLTGTHCFLSATRQPMTPSALLTRKPEYPGRDGRPREIRPSPPGRGPPHLPEASSARWVHGSVPPPQTRSRLRADSRWYHWHAHRTPARFRPGWCPRVRVAGQVMVTTDWTAV